ncbi:hypothetical protein ACFYVL_00855 [Streptomyces sp. NPDC004111]|uniref:hypothetical protein n=1 Tax=Streptomyces sp. NPDC004111 TaxID=3364690 RepID=UPI00369CAA19
MAATAGRAVAIRRPARRAGWGVLFSELVAFTAVRLIAAWGEVFPRWIPVLRGRRVPPLAAVVPAAIGTVLLRVIWTAAFAADFAG